LKQSDTKFYGLDKQERVIVREIIKEYFEGRRKIGRKACKESSN
jgi:hypothetical protein